MADGSALAIALAQYVQLKVFFGKVLRLAHFYETLSEIWAHLGQLVSLKLIKFITVLNSI